MPRVIIVGGGILGTMHAVEARRRGWSVRQLDLDAEPHAATARNSGTIWVGPRAPGIELQLALRARDLWMDLAARAPGIGFRTPGSIILAQSEAHLAVLQQVAERPDAERRGYRLLTREGVGALNPPLDGRSLGGLYNRLDATIEPRLVLPAIRNELLGGDDYEFLGGRQVWEIDDGRVVDTTGRVHAGDLVLICAGARPSALANMVTARAPLAKVRVQMLQTAPTTALLTTLLADGDAVRLWAAFDVPARAALPPAPPVVEEFGLQVMCVQRASGALTIGETHIVEEPFAFDLSERPYDHMVERVRAILGDVVPPVVRRWDGVYQQCHDDRIWYRELVDEGVLVITGAGGRGLTLAPAIAEDTFRWFEDGVDSGGSERGALRPPA